jgi:hypothetical protein
MTKKEAAPKQPEVAKTLEELMLNFPGGKYSAIPLAAQWAKVLRRREEHRHLTSNEILEAALRDVLIGKIDWKDVKKAIAAAPEIADPLNGADEKAKEK